MKKNNYLGLILSASLLFLASCSKDSPAHNEQLSKMSVPYGYTFTYKYDTQNRLNTLNREANNLPTWLKTFFYDQNNRIVRVDAMRSGTNTVDPDSIPRVTTFDYKQDTVFVTPGKFTVCDTLIVDNGLLLKKLAKESDLGADVQTFEYDSKNNMVKRNFVHSDSSVTTWAYEYDNMSGVGSNIGIPNWFAVYNYCLNINNGGRLYLSYKNNVTTFTEGLDSFSYEYAYDSSGYPTSSVRGGTFEYNILF